MATPLGTAGIAQLPNEKPVMDAFMANIPKHGFYFFPGMDVPFDAPRAQRQAAMPAYLAKYSSGPVGILVYRPVGGSMMTPHQLIAELLSNILQGLALAMILALLAQHTLRAGAYVGFATGICAATATNISYWNWYGFPSNYTAAAIVTELIGYILMGLTIGGLLARMSRSRAA
jgi:F0F1-type ATP synthase assembly protein I